MDGQNRFEHISKDAIDAIDYNIWNNINLDNKDPKDNSPPPTDEYEINKIIGHYITMVGGYYEVMYVVEWRDNNKTITEEPSENLTNCDQIVNTYILAKFGGKITNKGIIYNRVSTKKQFNTKNITKNEYSQGCSMETQYNECINFCIEHKIFPYRIIQEVGSAYNGSRPKFSSMMKFINNKDVIIVHEPDRFSRNTTEFNQALAILTRKQCDLVIVRDQIDTMGNTPDVMRKIREAELASTEKSKKMIERQRIKRNQRKSIPTKPKNRINRKPALDNESESEEELINRMVGHSIVKKYGKKKL